MKTSKLALLVLSVVIAGPCLAQKTDASLFLKSDGVQVPELASKSGDLYKTAGHHGPAVENPWFALRMYFDKNCGIDVHSKQHPQLELRKALWYPTEADQKNGWGADYYKVGKTVGIRLWDGKQAVPLHPVSQRISHANRALAETPIRFNCFLDDVRLASVGQPLFLRTPVRPPALSTASTSKASSWQ
jgi:hypothetical protein